MKSCKFEITNRCFNFIYLYLNRSHQPFTMDLRKKPVVTRSFWVVVFINMRKLLVNTYTKLDTATSSLNTSV